MNPATQDGQCQCWLAIPPEAAWMIALGANEAMDGRGRVYEVPSKLTDGARRYLGLCLIQTAVDRAQVDLAERMQREMAEAWPGYFQYEPTERGLTRRRKEAAR